MTEKMAKVAVLLATKNGIRWIAEQVNSILEQQGVDVKLIISDDNSTDGTLEWLEALAETNDRVTLLCHNISFGSAGKNFYRLILEADISDCNFIALADQDDVWLKIKLNTQVKLLVKHKAEGVSSNVVAFWPDGSRALIYKSEPMLRVDFLFESSGPGCTFLLSPWLITQVKIVLSDPNGEACKILLHDWLIYAVCRASGRKWYINPVPTMKYRQHNNNVIGVNYGTKARLTRLKNIANGWYRREVVKICLVCQQLSHDMYLKSACDAIIVQGLISRGKRLKLMSQARRKLSDRLLLTIVTLLFLF